MDFVIAMSPAAFIIWFLIIPPLVVLTLWYSWDTYRMWTDPAHLQKRFDQKFNK